MLAANKASVRTKFLNDLGTKGITPFYFYKCSVFDVSDQNDTIIHNTYGCSSYNDSTIIHPPLEFFEIQRLKIHGK